MGVLMDGNVKKAYVCGNSRVYFRAGALEYLEAQQLIALEPLYKHIGECTKLPPISVTVKNL